MGGERCPTLKVRILVDMPRYLARSKVEFLLTSALAVTFTVQGGDRFDVLGQEV
jgi:hypothetical protein